MIDQYLKDHIPTIKVVIPQASLFNLARLPEFEFESGGVEFSFRRKSSVGIERWKNVWRSWNWFYKDECWMSQNCCVGSA